MDGRACVRAHRNLYIFCTAFDIAGAECVVVRVSLYLIVHSLRHTPFITAMATILLEYLG